FPDAEHKFKDAETLCAQVSSPVCADVATGRGTLEMERGHYEEAHHFVQRVLGLARADGDQLRVANAMLDLSWSANEQAHFDEALDWSDAARQLAMHLGFAGVAETALGNMGWAYYKLGDREKARPMFAQAEKQAQQLGDVTDQISWLTNAGYINMDDGDFKVAEQSFQQSLKLAQQINSAEDIVNSLIALAFVCERTGRLVDAKRYADEVFSRARADGNKDDENYARLVQARVAAQQHDTAVAEAGFHDVAQSPAAAVFLKWEAERSQARLYEDENQSAFAEREYRTALTTFETARSELQ